MLAATRLFTRQIRLRVRIRERSGWTREKAAAFARQLDAPDRRALQEALNANSLAYQRTSESDVTPSTRQLVKWGTICGIPFVGFGLIDNCIMITAGEYIDMTIGARLGISTMAAAALGNMVSDVSGLGLAGFIETFSSKIADRTPKLSSQQVQMRKSRIAAFLGRIIGVCLGCTLGMFPLLLMPSKENADTD
ncbi:transmembrane protein 65-like [Oscarella lobularis]|uniref:transmembrane protein 65-like n=1 Tax=Oscarella lobularis TaxID=121494 RepID=UPI003313CAEB